MNANSPFVEKRQFGRRAVLKHAVICGPGEERMGAIVIDLSEGGARIRADDLTVIPSEFDLEIPADDFTVRCRIVHYQPTTIGVQFIRSPTRISWRTRRVQPELPRPARDLGTAKAPVAMPSGANGKEPGQ